MTEHTYYQENEHGQDMEAQTTATIADFSEAAKRPYQAITLGKSRGRQSRLRVHDHEGRVRLFTYSHLVEVMAVPEENSLWLVFTNCILRIDGVNLFTETGDAPSLVEILQDEQVRSLHWYDPQAHQMPKEGERVITGMLRQRFGELAGESESGESDAAEE